MRLRISSDDDFVILTDEVSGVKIRYEKDSYYPKNNNDGTLSVVASINQFAVINSLPAEQWLQSNGDPISIDRDPLIRGVAVYFALSLAFAPPAAPVPFKFDFLNDVDETGKLDGDVFTWDNTSSTYKPEPRIKPTDFVSSTISFTGSNNGPITAEVTGGTSPWTENFNSVYYTGSVNIGSTTSPIDKLNVYGSGFRTANFASSNNAVQVRLTPATGSHTNLISNTTGNFYVDAAQHVFRDQNSSNERMRIDTLGNVGIGTSIPRQKLHVEGNAQFSDGSTIGVYSGETLNIGMVGGSSGATVAFTDSNVGIGTTSPSTKLEVNGPIEAGTGTVVSGETATDASIVFPKGTYIKSDDGYYLRNVIGHASNGQIQIGQYSGFINGALIDAGVGEFKVRTGNGTDKFLIDSIGNVGIGTSTPSAPLTVVGNSYLKGDVAVGPQANAGAISGYTLSVRDTVPSIYLKDQTGVVGDGRLHVENNVFSIGVDPDNATTDAALRFETRGSERMRIDHDGNVGFGTTTPSEKLTVDGNIRVLDGNKLMFRSSGDIYGAEHLVSSYEYKIQPSTGNGYSNLYIGSNSGRLIQLYGGHSWLGVNNVMISSKPIRVPHNGGFGFQSYGSTNDVSAIESIYTDNNTSGIKFLTRELGVDTERMRIDSSGNVGIGTTTPSSKLDIYGGESRFGTDQLGYVQILGNGGGGVVKSNKRLYLETFGGYDMDLKSTGNYNFKNNAATTYVHFDGTNERVGVGTTAPESSLHIAGTTGITMGRNSAQNQVARVYADAGDNLVLTSATGSGKSIKLNNYVFGSRIDWAFTNSTGNKLDFTLTPNGWGGSNAPSLASFNSSVGYSTGDWKMVKIENTLNQSGDAAFTDLFINRTENSTGTGNQLFIDAQTNSVSKFSVDSQGKVTPQSIRFDGTINSGVTFQRDSYGVKIVGDSVGTIGTFKGSANLISWSQPTAWGGVGVASTGRVGIKAHNGASTPFFVQDYGNNPLLYTTVGTGGLDGKVGIGTTTPSASLHVKGANALAGNYALKVTNNSDTEYLSIQNDGTFQIGPTVKGIANTSNRVTITSGNTQAFFGGEDIKLAANNTGKIILQTDYVNNVVLTNGGNFGIGTTTPSEKLHVAGQIKIDDGVNPFTLPASDGTANQVLSTDGAGTVTWVDQSGGAATDAEIGQAYKTTSQTLSTTPAAITSWTTETQDDLSIFDPTTGALTITQAGKYLIAFEADFDMSVFVDRENPFAYIEKDGTEISGSRRHSYQRSVGAGEASVALTMVYEHTTGTAVFKAVIGAEIGVSTTSLVNASMSYSTLGGTQGPQGVSGDAFAVSTEAAGRTLVAGDHLKYLRSTSATAVTFTVPPQSSVSWVDNAEIVFEQGGTGQITIAAGSGVTINSSETLKSSSQYAVIALKRVASDTWTLTGERELL